jgi:hypothetical protein
MLPSCYLHVTFVLPSCYLHVTFMLPSCYLHVTALMWGRLGNLAQRASRPGPQNPHRVKCIPTALPSCARCAAKGCPRAPQGSKRAEVSVTSHRTSNSSLHVTFMLPSCNGLCGDADLGSGSTSKLTYGNSPISVLLPLVVSQCSAVEPPDKASGGRSL